MQLVMVMMTTMTMKMLMTNHDVGCEETRTQLLELGPREPKRNTAGGDRGLHSSFDREKPPYKKLPFLDDFIKNWAPL